jgi:hypothetical protein
MICTIFDEFLYFHSLLLERIPTWGRAVIVKVRRSIFFGANLSIVEAAFFSAFSTFFITPYFLLYSFLGECKCPFYYILYVNEGLFFMDKSGTGLLSVV